MAQTHWHLNIEGLRDTRVGYVQREKAEELVRLINEFSAELAGDVARHYWTVARACSDSCWDIR